MPRTKELIQALYSGKLLTCTDITLRDDAIFDKEGTQEIQEGWRGSSRKRTKPTTHEDYFLYHEYSKH